MASGNFERCKDLTAVSEGGWSDHPDDPGGATMKGVTLKTYAAWCKLHGKPEPTKVDLKVISDVEVSAIFKAQYWDAARCDLLPLGVDYAVFDFAINSGPARAVMELQRVIGEQVDGVVGTRTLAAIAGSSDTASDIDALINDYQDGRLAFMKGLKTWATFGKGWERRVEKVRRQAKAMVVSAPTERSSQEPVPKAAGADQKVAGTTEGVGNIAGVSGATGTAVMELAKQIEPLASTAEVLQWVFALLVIAGVAITTYTMLRNRSRRV